MSSAFLDPRNRDEADMDDDEGAPYDISGEPEEGDFGDGDFDE